MNDILSVSQCNLSSKYTIRLWGHLNLNGCNQICLNFLHSQEVKMQKLGSCAPSRMLAPKRHL